MSDSPFQQIKSTPRWTWRTIASHLLVKDAYEHMSAQAEVLEQDKHGIKVLRLVDGDILKIFRVKRLISSASIYSYARQFCRNAARLQVLGIPTVQIKQLYHFADSKNSAVLYQPLPGKTIRQLIAASEADDALFRHLGVFVAKLHYLGVYFRSLHFGNIVLTPEHQLGLIDIADMSIFPWKLGNVRRERNFRHLVRVKEDWVGLNDSCRTAFLEGYESASAYRPSSHLFLDQKQDH
ncbi:MAG: toluene tolerance protein [Methylophilaceae bacterium]